MDIAQLKGTDNTQFANDAEIDIRHPVTDETFKATIKSVKNPELGGDITVLMGDYSRESAKLEKGNLTTEQAQAIKTRIINLGNKIAHHVTVKFDGLTSDGKPVKCTDDMKKDMLDNYDWISSQIVEKASSENVFYNTQSKTS